MSGTLARAPDVRLGHVVALAATALGILAPLAALATMRSPGASVPPTPPWFALTEPVLRRLLLTSAALAASVAALAGIGGLALGVALGTTRSPWSRFGAALHLLPLCIPPYLLALGTSHALARGGVLDTLAGPAARAAADGILRGPAGFVAIQVLALTPLVTLLVTAAVRGLDPSSVDAGVLARGPTSALREVVARPALPAATAGATLVFLLTLGEVAVPTLLGVRTYAGTVFSRLADLSFLPGEALSRSLPLVLVALAGTAVLVRLDRRGDALPSARAGGGPRIGLLGRGRGRTAALGAAGVAALLPVAGLAWTVAGDPAAAAAIGPALGSARHTVVVVAGTTGVLVGVGLLGGHAWSRARRWEVAVAGAALLGLALPAIVLATGLVALYNRPSTGWIYGGSLVIVLGLGGRYLFVALRAFRVAFDAQAAAGEEAAWLARRGAVSRWLRVTAPSVARSTAATGLGLALLCLRDLDTTLAIYPPGGETLAVRILTLEANAPPAQIASLALAQIALSALLGAACLALLAPRRRP